jgi:hypothetical protein
VRLLIPTVLLKLRYKKEAEKNLKDMEQFLKNAVVRFKFLCAKSKTGGGPESSRTSRRLVSWTGRGLFRGLETRIFCTLRNTRSKLTNILFHLVLFNFLKLNIDTFLTISGKQT